MNDLLYHFFPRKFESIEQTVSIVDSIFLNGFYSNKEERIVDWEDRFKFGNKERTLKATQYRFCLTAISNIQELKSHSEIFGFIGMAFEQNLIVRMGGFPVFYIPTPSSYNKEVLNEEYIGVSLLYRLAENQELLEFILANNIIASPDIDIKNVLGSVKFLANIFYPTNGNLVNGQEVIYYNQREWRLVHEIKSDKVKLGICNNNKTIESYDGKPMREFIKKIIIFNNDKLKSLYTDSYAKCEEVYCHIQNEIENYKMNCEVEII